MSRLKTSAFWIFVVLTLGLGTYAYFHLKNNKKPKLEALSVIPDSCLVYLNTSDFFELNKKINSQSLIADKLKLFDDVHLLCGTLRIFDSLFNSKEALQDEIKDNLIHFGCYGKNNGWMAAFNIKRLGRQESITETLAEILHASKGGNNTYSFKVGKNKNFYFNLSEGVATISNSEELIVHSLNKTKPKLANNPSFIQFKNTLTENSLINIYVNHNLYSTSNASGNLNLSYFSKKAYSAGAIDIQPSQVKINGYLKPDESEIISLFSEQETRSSDDIITILPLNTNKFKAFGFSDYPELRIGFPLTRIHIKFWMKVNEKSLYNTEDDFNGNAINHLVEFETGSGKQNMVALEVADTMKAREHLKYMSDTLIRQDSFIVHRIINPMDVPLQLFIPLSDCNTAYALLYQSHIFFSESVDKLFQLARDLKTGTSLAGNENFVSYKNQHFTNEFNYLVYCSPNRIIEDIPAFLNYKASREGNPFENFKHCSFSVSRDKQDFKFRFHLMNESENKTKEQNVLWTLDLDASSIMTANGFTNHITGENELIVQDENNVVYLINAKGTILWRKKINEKILSTIHTVDIYKKNKYQMLFNTQNYLHLIDRNGNYVESYPVKLPAEANAELSLFDYDNDKEYRILIPCKNNSIYNYSIHGLPQEKFAVVKTENAVNLPVQYVKVGESDYLVALDNEGKIYTFSRKGVPRIGLRNRTIANCSGFYSDASNSINTTYLVYLDDKSALLSKVSFADRKEIVKLSQETENAFVSYCLVDDNRSMDLIISKNNSFAAYNFSGNMIMEKHSEFPLGKTSFYSDESHSIFYSLSEDRTSVSVYDQLRSKVKIFKGGALPLVSNLFKDNKKYLIITNGNQLNCVLLN